MCPLQIRELCEVVKSQVISATDSSTHGPIEADNNVVAVRKVLGEHLGEELSILSELEGAEREYERISSFSTSPP